MWPIVRVSEEEDQVIVRSVLQSGSEDGLCVAAPDVSVCGDYVLDLGDSLGRVEVDVGPRTDGSVLVADSEEADLLGTAEPGCPTVGELADYSILCLGHPDPELADQSGSQVGESDRLCRRVGDGRRTGILHDEFGRVGVASCGEGGRADDTGVVVEDRDLAVAQVAKSSLSQSGEFGGAGAPSTTSWLCSYDAAYFWSRTTTPPETSVTTAA